MTADGRLACGLRTHWTEGQPAHASSSASAMICSSVAACPPAQVARTEAQLHECPGDMVAPVPLPHERQLLLLQVVGGLGLPQVPECHTEAAKGREKLQLVTQLPPQRQALLVPRAGCRIVF